MKEFWRTRRIESIIDRIDRRGAKLMYRAIKEDYGGTCYIDCLRGIEILRNRIMRISAMVDRTGSPVKRRTA